MSYLRTNKAQLAAIIALAGLLFTLAVFQYIWLGQLSEREQERMEDSVDLAVRAVRWEFDGDLADLYQTFQVDYREAESFPEQIAARYAEWTDAVEVQVIDRLYWINNDEDTGLVIQQFHGTDHLVALDEWPEDILHHRPEFKQSLRHSDAQFELLVGPPPLQDDIPALVIQQVLTRRFDTLQERESISWIVIILSRDAIFGQLIPELADRYIYGAESFDFNVAIQSSDNPQSLVYASNPDLTADSFAEPDAERGIYSLHPWHFDQRSISNRRAWRVVEESASSRWNLLVKHQAGSLESAVQAARNRSLAISLGVLALLGGSIGMIVVSTRRAQRLAEQQMEFVAGVSHELRTPLAVIRAAGENLADEVVHDPEKTRQYGELIDREGRRLSDMVERVLLFSKIRSENQRFERNRVDMREVIADAIQASRSLLAEQSVVIEKDVPEFLPTTMADAEALKSALGNVLSNAIKYSHRGGIVKLQARVSSAKSGSGFQIAVHDQGDGIPAAELPHLFEPFFRGKRAQRAQIQGSGLGLNLVKRVLEAHGGRVTVDSSPGEGSSFVLFLPVESPDGEADSAGRG